MSPSSPISSPATSERGFMWVGGGIWGGCDCCLCVTVVQKSLCLFQGFTVKLSPLRDWVGHPRHLSPPYLQATSCSGEELEELCPSLVSTRHRSYFILLPPFFFFLFLFSSSLQQTCVILSSCSCLNIGLCCIDTVDVTEVSLQPCPGLSCFLQMAMFYLSGTSLYHKPLETLHHFLMLESAY